MTCKYIVLMGKLGIGLVRYAKIKVYQLFDLRLSQIHQWLERGLELYCNVGRHANKSRQWKSMLV